MTHYSINELRPSHKIIIDSEPFAIIDNQFIKPGKGQAFNRIRLRNLLSGKILEKIFKSGDLIKSADVVDINFIYLYRDSELWYFMNNQNFEQITADAKAVGLNYKWLVTKVQCVLTLWNNHAIMVTPPNFVELKIIDTDPGLKGDTAGGSGKPAILSTGAVVRVPLFVQSGEIIKVDTRVGEYVSRVKSN